MTNRRLLFSALVTAVLSLPLVLSSGCGFGCGVAPDPTAMPDGGAATASIENGVVTFTPTLAGTVVSFAIPIKDTADMDETISGARLDGPNAADFSITATVPMFVPAGQAVQFEIQFAPREGGPKTAQLLLQTEGMGVSTVQLAGTATVE
jgi:hypothetical protein